MIRALISGSIHGQPQARTSQAGKSYVTAKVRADGKDGASVWCSIIAFGEIADRLLTLGDGAALSISGRAGVNAWLDKTGEPRAGLSLVADEMVTLKGKPRPVESQGQEHAAGQGTGQNTGHGQGQRPPRPPRRTPRPAPVATGPDFDDALPDFM